MFPFSALPLVRYSDIPHLPAFAVHVTRKRVLIATLCTCTGMVCHC